MLINFIFMQVDLLAETLSKYGIAASVVAGAAIWVQRRFKTDEVERKEDRVRMLAAIDLYEKKLDDRNVKDLEFRERMILELSKLNSEIVNILKENHTVIRENQNVMQNSSRLIEHLFNGKNSHSL